MPAILETDRIGSEHYESPFGERDSECLKRVPGESTHFALAEMSLAIVLVVNEDGWTGRAAARRNEQERRNAISVRTRVHDASAFESV